MSSHAADDSSGGVLSFTFLDVLTCTMGSLVLLLVVLGERAKRAVFAEVVAEQAKAVSTASADPGSDAASTASDPLTAEEAAAHLAQIQARQAELEKMRADVTKHLRQEELRVAHLEDHERRLEHELAKLHFTLERLDEAEQKLQVDQEAAKRNLERLTSLVADAQQQIEEAKEAPTAKRSYAIVPYKGANGTFRRPIYVECTKEAVIIQPEGIRLTAADFDGPLRSGNPLAAAVRAAQEELRTRQPTADEQSSQDAYPLLVVRPNGAAAYGAALSAIAAWDAEYGYEFVDADWDLEFPAPDARLGQVMAHAVDQARARQALLAKAAPRRYASRLRATGSGTGGGAGDGAGAEGFGMLAEGAGDGIGQHAGEGQLGGGQRMANQPPGGPGSGKTSEARYGEFSEGGGDPAQGDFADQFADSTGSTGSASAASEGMPGGPGGGSPAGQPGSADAASAAGKDAGQRNAFATAGAGYSANSASASSGAEPPPDVHAPPTAAAAGSPTAMASSAPSAADAGDHRSAADSRGVNWANAAASHKASAISRPIKVIVGPNEIALLPEGSGDASDATVVTFRQSTGEVLDQLADAVQSQIKEWGLAGRAMYWRPTLVLQVAPGAERQATRLSELLHDSGLDVRLPQATAQHTEGASYAR